MAEERAQLQTLDVLPLRDRVEQNLSNAILNGVFRPGERLVESAIAETLGVSRAPLREALAALERERIVMQIPRRGYFVVDLTEKDIEEIYSLRLMLEIGALGRAKERVTEEDLADLQRLVDELGDAARDQRDPEAIVALDLAFHRHLCHLAGHSRLVAAWNRLQLQTQMLIGWTSKTHYPQPDQPRETHQRIVDALREKDMELGKRYLTDHLIDAQRRAMMASQSLRSGSAGGEERDY